MTATGIKGKCREITQTLTMHIEHMVRSAVYKLINYHQCRNVLSKQSGIFECGNFWNMKSNSFRGERGVVFLQSITLNICHISPREEGVKGDLASIT